MTRRRHTGTDASRPSALRPVRPFIPVLATALVVGGWQEVAHNSGSGWVQALGDALAGALVIGLVAPACYAWRARVQVRAVPADGAVGLPLELLVHASTRLRVRPVDPAGPEAFVGPGGAPAVLLPRRRGVYESVVVEWSTAAPFAILWWRRTASLALPRPLHVAPRLGPRRSGEPRPDEGAPPGVTSVATSASTMGEPAGVRPYARGDARRRVHWPATAHTGELMVRRHEAPRHAPVVVSVVLPADPDAAEEVASRALGTVVAWLDDGVPVVLRTHEADGAVSGTVADRHAAGRRLARAVAPPAVGEDAVVGSTTTAAPGGVEVLPFADARSGR